ncbi:MAG: hypothetical protein CMB16_06790 [Euryarchaeota archaeon]|nr:hypothetical protein [Euryarchaeota archaeon]|tara:strand:- start:5103 stop:6383 length:1281 start_codon:yes stop_codon:yes gene_type:complete
MKRFIYLLSTRPDIMGSKDEALGLHGTFVPNKSQSIHRWYPYVEGFSNEFVSSLLNEFAIKGQTVYDPFAGTGTTVCVAQNLGMKSVYSEINPFMRLVIEAKTNHANNVITDIESMSEYFERVTSHATSHPISQKSAIQLQTKAFGKSEIFSGKDLIEIISIKESLAELNPDNESFKAIADMALGSIAVGSSNMIRRADLRKRKAKEFNLPNYSVIDCFKEKLNQILNDLRELTITKEDFRPKLLGNSALVSHGEDMVDVVLTSPPYVNGTNYFRNTKIELWLTGFIQSTNDLRDLRDKAMAAGINSVSKRGRAASKIKSVEDIATKIDAIVVENGKDKRVPELIRRYFSDTILWLENSYRLLKEGGKIIVDIGDSYFYNIHVPADRLLLEIAESVGFRHIETRYVRDRHSNNGKPLKQVLHIMSK